MFKPIRFAVVLAGMACAFAAFAQPAQQDVVDPPSRVARLSYIQGAVSFVPAGENDWVEAQLNRPLITGDKLWTDSNSRAALEIGAAAVRIDQQTSFDFLNLDDNTAQMELTQGTLNLRVRRLYDGQSYEVDTPTLAFVVNRVGEFRIDVQPDGQSTVVTVISGGGDVYGEDNARFSVEEGQSVTFNDPQLRDYRTASLPPPDAFDDFCSQRNRRWDDSNSRRYVSEDVIGYQDLDQYGSWNNVPEYGNVWYPTSVQAGWSPYQDGHWAWVGAYGWTWVDAAPWGFAPFHYGRWANIDNRWGWCPGPVSVRPYYAPALVAFVGGGGGIGLSLSGPIGWFPLGYRDVYFPSYRTSRNYFRNVNVSNTVINTTVINNYYGNYSRGNVNYSQIRYANRNVAGAVVAVPASAFLSARPVARAEIAVNARTFANSRVSGFAAVAPTRASVVPAVAARSRPTAAVLKRPIVAATRPPAPVASFAQRQAVLAKDPGRPLNERQLRAPVAAAARGATKRTAPVVAVRPNVRVVTQHGAPVRTAAPVLPARAAANGHGATPGTRTGPASRSGTEARHPPVRTPTPGSERGPAVRPSERSPTTRPNTPAEQPRHLDSSRFAHPQTGSTPPTREQPARQPPARSEANERPNRGVTPPSRTTAPAQSREPVRTPVQSREPVRAPVQSREPTRAPVQSREPVRAPVQSRESVRTPVQSREPVRAPMQSREPVGEPQSEYRAPAQQQRPEYRQPEPRQEAQPQAQPRQEYHAPPVRQAAPPAERKAEPEKKKDDDKQHGRN